MVKNKYQIKKKGLRKINQYLDYYGGAANVTFILFPDIYFSVVNDGIIPIRKRNMYSTESVQKALSYLQYFLESKVFKIAFTEHLFDGGDDKITKIHYYEDPATSNQMREDVLKWWESVQILSGDSEEEIEDKKRLQGAFFATDQITLYPFGNESLEKYKQKIFNLH